jgi:glycosyltransferase involved in cell wall biosynthesis
VISATSAAPRRVLFLAYYFPPLGGGGVQRSIAFTRYLPEFGYQPLVISRPSEGEVAWGPRDETLAARLRSDLQIFRVDGPEAPLGDGRAERWLRRPSRFATWWSSAVESVGRDVVKSVDVVYASMSPFATAAAAARLAAESGKPWVADLRDPWALDDWLVYPTRFHRRLELRQMRRVLSSAAAVVMNTPEAAAELRRRAPELATAPIVTIPNGFDAADFAQVETRWPRRRDVFRIVHAGHVFTSADSRSVKAVRRLLGGAAPGLDVRTRSHLFLVRAVERVIARRPELAPKIELHLVGPLSHRDREELPSEISTHPHGYLSHTETIAALCDADLLFLPLHELAAGTRTRIIPGKTYEYLASGTPILAAVPAGDCRDLLLEARNSFVSAPSDVAFMADVIEREIDRAAAGRSPGRPQRDVLALFERRHLTARLANVFDEVLGIGLEAQPAREPTLAGAG